MRQLHAIETTVVSGGTIGEELASISAYDAFSKPFFSTAGLVGGIAAGVPLAVGFVAFNAAYYAVYTPICYAASGLYQGAALVGSGLYAAGSYIGNSLYSAGSYMVS